MVGEGCQAAGPLQNHFLGYGLIQDFGCDPLRFAFGDRPRLVESNDLQLTGILQIDAAFDQNPPTCCAGEPTHYRNGRCNHQGTGTGDHKKDQGFVKRLRPAPLQQPRGQERYGQRDHEHSGRVEGCKAIDKALHRRLAALSGFNRVDDPGQCGLSGSSRHPEFQQP